MDKRKTWDADVRTVALYSAMKTSLRGLGSERDVVAKALKTTHQVPRGPSLLKPVQVGRAQIFVRHTRGQHLVCGDEDLMADRHRGPLCTASSSKPVELVPEVAAFRSGRRYRGLDEGRPQAHVALPGPGSFLFA